jgi:hypothetical protein
MAYLNDHPPDSKQFICPRRDQESGVFVVHTAENTPDFVAFDGGAEAVARFISTRPDPGSYHDLVDSDSTINLVDYGCEAFHVARDGFNRHAYGVSAATRADVWPLAPEAWKNGCTRQMAGACARQAVRVRQLRGIVVPARRITRAQALDRVPGFVSHAELDPTRRTDPGRFFPWPQFLAEFARLTIPPPPEEDEMPYALIRCTAAVTGGSNAVYALFPSGNVRNVTGAVELGVYTDLPVKDESNGQAARRLANAHEAVYGPAVA